VTACGGSSAPPSNRAVTSNGTAPAATSTPSTAAAGTVEDLTFDGAVTGRMTAAHRGGAYSCGKLGSTWTAGPIEGDIAGRAYDMDIRVSGYKGPGTYEKGGELTPGSGVASVFVQITPKGEDMYSMTKA